MAVRKLVISNLLSRKVRAGLTVAAVALAVSLVVSVTSGYASVEAAIYKYLNQYLGTVDVEIFRSNDPSVGAPKRFLLLECDAGHAPITPPRPAQSQVL